MDEPVIAGILAASLPEQLPKPIQSRFHELRQAHEDLSRLQSGLDAERAGLHLEPDPFGAAEDLRRRVLASWRQEATLWLDLKAFAGELLEELMMARIVASGALTSAQIAARKAHYAEHAEEIADYALSQVPEVADAEYRLAAIKSCEHRWTPVLQRGEAEARACDRRVVEAIQASLAPILDAVS